MFAIAFDLVVVQTENRHPKGVAQAYADIGNTLERFGFRRIQGSVYVTDGEDMANLYFRSSWPSRSCLGFLIACATSVLFGSSSGPISLR
jgi:virulence-associated protein VapD